MTKNKNQHPLIKKFKRYYESNAQLQNYESRKSILNYLIENTYGTEIIREFNSVWEMYSESGLLHIPTKQRAKSFVS